MVKKHRKSKFTSGRQLLQNVDELQHIWTTG